jgi:energy-coupling factor transport system ATP-binding protein
MEVVADFARRVLVLSGGRLIGDGPVREIMRDRELLDRASLLPAQIPALAQMLGPRFDHVFTVDDMVKELAGSREPDTPGEAVNERTA